MQVAKGLSVSARVLQIRTNEHQNLGQKLPISGDQNPYGLGNPGSAFEGPFVCSILTVGWSCCSSRALISSTYFTERTTGKANPRGAKRISNLVRWAFKNMLLLSVDKPASPSQPARKRARESFTSNA